MRRPGRQRARGTLLPIRRLALESASPEVTPALPTPVLVPRVHTAVLEIPDGTTLLTVNQRLARALRGAHDARQIAAGRRAWEPADVLPYGAWLQRTWSTGMSVGEGPLPVPLTPWQEWALWEAALNEIDPPAGGGALLNRAAAARAAQEALALLRAYRCEARFAAEPLAEDALVFRRWARVFKRGCAEGGWMDAGALADALAPRFDDMRDKLPERLLLAGFDELTPQQQAIVAALRAAGTSVAPWAPPPRAGRAVRAAFDDPEAELVAAARWARALLEDGVQGPIGIVVLDLAGRRGAVERIFDDVLCPGARLPGAEHAGRPYQVSLGMPLARIPLVADALLALRLAQRALPAAEIGHLMRSPYLGGAEAELPGRALWEAALREEAQPELSLRRLLAHLRTSSGKRTGRRPQAPLLAQLLTQLARELRCTPAVQSPAGWTESFSRWLHALGWPGERGLDGAEHQALQAFAELLDDYAAIGAVVARHGSRAALAWLARMAAERVFQPQGEPASVQVLGALEASGLRFARLWVAGLHDAAWPAAPRPNPFLPVSLQRRRAMPHASAERELEFACRVTSRLVASADEVVLTYPLQTGAERLRPSPLIARFPAVEAAALPRSAWCGLAQHVHATRPRLESRADERGPALVAGELTRGGARIFRDQAACPFRAFATHRLGARALGTPAPALDTTMRGVLVHRLLAALWAVLGGQGKLNELAAPQLERVVVEAVEVSVRRLQGPGRDALRGRRGQLERERLRRLAWEWLELERRRTAFDVAALEAEIQARFGALEVTLRLDRLDRIAGAGSIIIDYKTGPVSPAAWFGPRPDEPQLPLYCVASPEPVSGIAYALVRPGETALKGIAETEGVAPGVRRADAGATPGQDWQALRHEWRHALEDLAAAFVAGDARVDPKRWSETCRECGMQALCRVHEHRPVRLAPERWG